LRRSCKEIPYKLMVRQMLVNQSELRLVAASCAWLRLVAL
jgi:hypothetical protein